MERSRCLRTRWRPRMALGVDLGVVGGLVQTGLRCAAAPYWATELGCCCGSGSRPRRASGVSGPSGLAGVLPLALDDWSAAVAAWGLGLPAVLTRGGRTKNVEGCRSWPARCGRLRASRSETWCTRRSAHEERTVVRSGAVMPRGVLATGLSSGLSSGPICCWVPVEPRRDPIGCILVV
ncbi:hypothetical protein NDU88_006306 [Pleurodeles waltl]|uniref:Secreted protein n=1 Tax=Pleurodeles waltl TaxID=8319 RepID=A0AAV7WD32_PLEWA|nr:hypothetical protein NDU88_006306 [Pleurodeles waltl]